MAAIWPGSRVPNFGIGDRLSFYDTATSTPQVVYADGALSVAHDQPIRADARGMFPVIYLSPAPGSYRQKLTDANGVLIFDDDDIDVPQSADYEPPDPGVTDPTLLVSTGMRIGYYGTAAPAGWVRCNGRSLGSAASGASERANADCQALFLHLWTADATLTVSGGRGASAAGDWAANKTITLPDYRDRIAIGLGAMGNTDANRIPDTLIDGGENNTTLGATVGAATHTLTAGQMPAHLHAKGTLKMPNHGHPTRMNPAANVDSDTYGGIVVRGLSGPQNKVAWTGAPEDLLGRQVGGSGAMDLDGDMANAGSGEAHPNIQPSTYELVIIKL
jgi:microcystin-dependent protein